MDSLYYLMHFSSAPSWRKWNLWPPQQDREEAPSPPPPPPPACDPPVESRFTVFGENAFGFCPNLQSVIGLENVSCSWSCRVRLFLESFGHIK
mmetsp:Transcript_10512/g.29030  ORF Transcript_10512/g.29030 Transcript_10512/m.29030 type:complete len:93 (-) Transcript_10512:343-621(-)